MQAPLRLLTVAAVTLAVGLPAWAYSATHDVGTPLGQVFTGEGQITWPPPERPEAPVAARAITGLIGLVLAPLHSLTIALLWMAGLGRDPDQPDTTATAA